MNTLKLPMMRVLMLMLRWLKKRLKKKSSLWLFFFNNLLLKIYYQRTLTKLNFEQGFNKPPPKGGGFLFEKELDTGQRRGDFVWEKRCMTLLLGRENPDKIIGRTTGNGWIKNYLIFFYVSGCR